MRKAMLVVAALAFVGCSEKHPSTHTQAGDRHELEFTLRSEDKVGVGLAYFDVAVRGPNGAYDAEDVVARARKVSDAPADAVDINVQRLGQGRFMLLDVPLSSPGEWLISVSGKTESGWRDTASFELAVR